MLEAGSIMERQSDLIGTRSSPPDFLRLLISSDEGFQPHCIYINFLHSRYVLFFSRPSGMKLIPKYTSFLYKCLFALFPCWHTCSTVYYTVAALGDEGSVFIEVVVVYEVLFGKFYRWTILQCLYSHLIGDVEEPIWLWLALSSYRSSSIPNHWLAPPLLLGGAEI